MTEIRKLWIPQFPPFPEGELAKVQEAGGPLLGQAAGCFWLFRLLHSMESPAAVLMGDYCFGRFSHHLAAIDSVELTNAFAAYLKKDSLCSGNFEEYLEFLKSLAGIG